MRGAQPRLLVVSSSYAALHANNSSAWLRRIYRSSSEHMQVGLEYKNRPECCFTQLPSSVQQAATNAQRGLRTRA